MEGHEWGDFIDVGQLCELNGEMQPIRSNACSWLSTSTYLPFFWPRCRALELVLILDLRPIAARHSVIFKSSHFSTAPLFPPSPSPQTLSSLRTHLTNSTLPSRASLPIPIMHPAFVPRPPVSARSSFSGLSLKSSTTTCRPILTMTATPISRRQALSAAAALITGATLSPLIANAKSGDSPKISVFGVGGQSSPFTAGVQQGGKVIYKTFNDDEITLYKRIITDSKDRLAGAIDSIKGKSWEDVRSRIRLEAYDLRKTQLTVNANIDDKKTSDAATKAYKAFKNDLENLDQAAVEKNPDKAFKFYNASLKSLSAWQDTVGF